MKNVKGVVVSIHAIPWYITSSLFWISEDGPEVFLHVVGHTL